MGVSRVITHEAYVVQWQRRDGRWLDQIEAADLPQAREELAYWSARTIVGGRWRIIHRVTATGETVVE